MFACFPLDFLPELFVDHDATPIPKHNSVKLISARSTPVHWPAVKLSRLPAGLNQKLVLQKKFERFGSIQKIICQQSLDCAYVAFDSVAAAQRAKRNGHTSVSNSDPELPSTVLLTLAQCRSRLSSGSSNTSLSSSPPTRTSVGVKRKLSPSKSSSSSSSSSSFFSPREREKSHLDIDTARQEAYPSSDFSSQPKQVKADGNNPLPKFACTVEERVTVLQAHQRAERARNPTTRVPIVDTFHQSEGGGTEDFSLVNVPNPIRGTCSDMCPELERYLRDLHQRVSVFECLPSTLSAGSSSWLMDHTRAVKDYERSSADQPTPLPCELRPTAVLQRTMAYLLASVADRPELDQSRNFWKSWYEFMWTRTRAIRKDVAQQRLCCPQIVGVMERIARFHIFCAARLVDQPVDSFDPRINSENLTQCLQTLKEMYNDLYSAEAGNETCVCPCEAEFRAYMLLMKLNDQSALNEVQMLPDHLLRSGGIRFAVAVHEAVTTNNFIRFFRLARAATCLNACLMHRYFVQVRGRALLRLAASFAGHPRREVQYPVETLTRQLEFEDRRETREFCESWGLSVVDDYVIFDKQMPPQPPELAWRERRAIRLIESKRSGTALSTLFNNGPVAPSDAQPPSVHSSFDSSGRFIGHTEENVNAEQEPKMIDDFSPRVTQNLFSHQTALRSDSLVSQPGYTSGRSIFTSDGSTLPPQPSLPSERERSIQMMNNQTTATEFVTEFVAELLDLKSVARETLAYEFLVHETHSKLIDQIVRSLLSEIVNTVVDTEQKGRLQCCLRDELYNSVLAETITKEVTQIARNCVSQEAVVHDIFWIDLFPDHINSLAKSCLIKAEADAYYQRVLTRRCFDHMQAWMCRKAEDEHDRALLRSMPACPYVHSNALRLVGLRVENKRMFGLRRTRSAREDVSDRPFGRFSAWADTVDHHFTWSALTPSKSFAGQRIAFYHPSALTHSPHLDHCQFCGIVIPWLQAKLIRFNPIMIDETAVLSKNLCGVFCLGDPLPPFSRLVNEQNLPVLVIRPFQWIESENDTTKSSSSNFRYLTLPCLENGQLIPHPGWVSVLQTEMDWLESTTKPLSSPSPPGATETRVTEFVLTSKPTSQRTLAQLIHQLIGEQFVRPMTMLSHDWSVHGLVDPSLESLIDAYHLVLTNLLGHIHEAPIVSRVEQLLSIRAICHTHFCSAPTSPDVHPWIHLVTRWRAWVAQIQPAPEHVEMVETAMRRAKLLFQRQTEQFGLRVNRMEILPDPLLAPWFRICMAVVRDRLDKLAASDVIPELGNDSLKALVNELGGTSQLLNETNQDPAMASLVAHFSQLGQPSTTVMMAVDLSLDSFRRIQITSTLKNSVPEDHKFSELKTKLDKLAHRLDDVELSMSRTLEETETHSFSWKRSQSLSRSYSCKH
ncbi:Protein xmas-2 [Fasciola hepatica]|uniref:Protein xmas-2 n=1 Tax=Fasciola hepatica TaxID=6192 RepID=A0A4E0RC03_FASHE|nr:Protein xmas-2 [Fasciola hepatica]